MPPPESAAAAAAARSERALGRGGWVKLIGGASNQDVVALEDLAAVYTLAGVHCIDVAADPAVVAAVRRGIDWARRRGAPRPWLMVSLSDGDDPHFRKAWFDPLRCPAYCPRPCERVCPVEAIGAAGVVTERCYGCGRCLPACPLGHILEQPRLLAPVEVPSLLARLAPDAVELHTRIGRAGPFAARLQQLLAAGVPWRWLAVSCGLETDAAPAGGPVGPDALAADLWQRYSLLRRAGLRPLWQLDGRPMSGDVGAGTAHAALRLLRRVGPLAPPGPLQLAGGTNEHTLPALQRLSGGVPPVAGVAFGGVARQRLQPLLREAEQRGRRLREVPDLRRRALVLARELVDPWRRRGSPASG